MAYFLIIPAFLLWVLVATATVFATRSIPALLVVHSYVLRISLWATVGLLVANAVLIGLLAFGFVAIDRAQASPSIARDALQLAWGLGAIGGPVVASALGWLGGCILGVVLAFLRGRRLTPDRLFKPKPLRGSS